MTRTSANFLQLILFTVFLSVFFAQPASATGRLWGEAKEFRVYKYKSNCQYGGAVVLRLEMKRRKFIPSAKEFNQRGIAREFGNLMAERCPNDKVANVLLNDRKGNTVAHYTLYKKYNWEAWPDASKLLNDGKPWWSIETESSGFLPNATTIAKVINYNESLNGLYRIKIEHNSQSQFGQFSLAAGKLDEGVFSDILNTRNSLVAEEIEKVKARIEALPMDYEGFQKIEKTIDITTKLSRVMDRSAHYPLNEYNGTPVFVDYTTSIVEFANKQAAIRSRQAASTLSRESALANARGQTRSFEERMKTTLGAEYEQTQIASQIQRRTDAKNANLAIQKVKDDYNSAFFNIALPPSDGDYSPPYLNPAEEALIPQHELAQINSVSVAAELGPEICTKTQSRTLIGGWAAGASRESTSCTPDFTEGKKRQRAEMTDAPTSDQLYSACKTQLKPAFCQCLSNKNSNHFTAEEYALFKKSPITYAYYIKDRAFYDPVSLGANNIGNMLQGIAALSSGNTSGSQNAFREMFLQRPSNAGELFTSCAL